jgi:hypothetical protein
MGKINHIFGDVLEQYMYWYSPGTRLAAMLIHVKNSVYYRSKKSGII